MARFFYDKVHNTKRTITHIIIIGGCIIGVIICFIITSNFQGKNKDVKNGTLSLNENVTIEVNEKYSNEIFFSKIEGVNLDDINVTYPDNFDVSVPGTYEITLNISDKNYKVNMKIDDTTKPELVLKEVTILPNNNYSANEFVESCTDNSGSECIIDFLKTGIDEDGNEIKYDNFTFEGTYPIKIVAKDPTGNESIMETKLIIKAEDSPQVETPQSCKYGNNEYDSELYTLTDDITNGGCAVSLDLYKDPVTMQNFNNRMEAETKKIIKDLQNTKIDGVPAVNRAINVILNKDGNGVVGYELVMTVTIKNNDQIEKIVEYKLTSSGKRLYSLNTYNLPE